jgi:hypothetical protein
MPPGPCRLHQSKPTWGISTTSLRPTLPVKVCGRKPDRSPRHSSSTACRWIPTYRGPQHLVLTPWKYHQCRRNRRHFRKSVPNPLSDRQPDPSQLRIPARGNKSRRRRHTSRCLQKPPLLDLQRSLSQDSPPKTAMCRDQLRMFQFSASKSLRRYRTTQSRTLRAPHEQDDYPTRRRGQRRLAHLPTTPTASLVATRTRRPPRSSRRRIWQQPCPRRCRCPRPTR